MKELDNLIEGTFAAKERKGTTFADIMRTIPRTGGLKIRVCAPFHLVLPLLKASFFKLHKSIARQRLLTSHM